MALLLGLLALPSAASAAGELDPSFDGDGRVLTDFGSDDSALGVAIQADGKIVAAGRTGGYPENFALTRYNPDGSLDPTFGGDGRVVTNFGADDVAGDIALQADGKVVAAGTRSTPSNDNFALARYTPDGSLDPSFGGDGMVVTDFGANDGAGAVAIQDDGRIVAAGSSGAGDNPPDFALARYNVDGGLDRSFGGDGRVVTDFGAFDFADDVAIQADGMIVAAGASLVFGGPSDFALARYNLDGSLDPGFGGDGRVVTDFGGGIDSGTGLALQADGRIVLAGYTITSSNPTNFALARYKPDGTLDPTFDDDGRVVTDFGGTDVAFAIAIQADGKLVAAGSAGADAPYDFALARYKIDGSLDPGFDGDGKVTTDFDGGLDQAFDVAIQTDGKIVAVGSSNAAGDYDFALARYLPGATQISVNDVASFEDNAGLTSFKFTVSLSQPSSETVTVSRRTADGSASAPSDYSALPPATLTFSPGQTTKTVTVKVKGDVAIEPNETFFVNLSTPTNAVMTDGQGKGTIANDDLSASVPCTITGTGGNDVLTGTPGNDVICGGNGDDQIYGLDGHDVLKGENGNDLLVGGNGFDLLVGATGADDLRGESGNDTLRGGDNGNDTLDGGADSDALFGNGGTDSLNTQDGISANDSADGGNGSDSCVFDPGDFVTSCP